MLLLKSKSQRDYFSIFLYKKQGFFWPCISIIVEKNKIIYELIENKRKMC